MHLYEIIESQNSSVHKELLRFQNAISNNQIKYPLEDIQFVFLCGANIKSGAPSRRRQDLFDFSSTHLPHTKFFLAESIFNIFEKEGQRTNLLEIEDDLFQFSDYIIIVLESESSFCELGAFAVNKEHRDKLIVINDLKYKNSPSFIMKGPVQAIDEITNSKNVLYYKMGEDGKEHGDGIGDVFSKLYKIIYKKPKKIRSQVENYNPNEHFSKNSIRFVHDLIYFASPITVPELSRVIRMIFNGKNENQLFKHIGLLNAINQISSAGNKYCSSLKAPFFNYGDYDIHNLIASFKNLYYRYDVSRLVWN